MPRLLFVDTKLANARIGHCGAFRARLAWAFWHGCVSSDCLQQAKRTGSIVRLLMFHACGRGSQRSSGWWCRTSLLICASSSSGWNFHAANRWMPDGPETLGQGANTAGRGDAFLALGRCVELQLQLVLRIGLRAVQIHLVNWLLMMGQSAFEHP